MTRSRLLLGIAGVLAGTAVLFLVLGAVFNLILGLVAVPFGAAAYFLWADATGRLQDRIRWRAVNRGADERKQRTERSAHRRRTTRWDQQSRWPHEDAGSPSMAREEALAALNLPPGADQRAIRRAYRDRVKAAHPDADSGDEDEFRRVRAAYDRLRGPRRGKG